MPSTQKHWDTIFSTKEDTTLGWYEDDPTATLRLLNQIKQRQQATLFVSGVGTSVLVDELIQKKSTLILNDISCEALNSLKQRLKKRLKKQVKDIIWLCQDISKPIKTPIPRIDIWIDRAVLHFLLEESDIQRYFDNLKKHLSPTGHVLFAEFSQIGAKKCAGLPLHLYTIEELATRLGTNFQLIDSFDYSFTNPRGEERPYIYALFQQQGE